MNRTAKLLLGIGAAVVVLWCGCANVLLLVSLVFPRLADDQLADSGGWSLAPAVESMTTTAVPAAAGATVTRIIDGDTIEVAINGVNYRLRYIGMDTPERGQPFFAAATEANRLLVEGQTVTLVKDVSETDRYGRLLRYVYLPDGTFVNAELVAQDYAQVATFPPDVTHQDLFITLEREAREAGRGLWAQPDLTSTPAAAPLSGEACDPAYPTVCIPPPPPDLNCGSIPYRDFEALPADPHNFDGDNDGIACES